MKPVREKKCNSCGFTKPMSEFYRNLTSTDGHRGACNTCSSKQYRGKGYDSEKRRNNEAEALAAMQKIAMLIWDKARRLRVK